MPDNFLTDEDEVWSYRRMLGIPWTKHVSNDEAGFKDNRKKKIFIFKKEHIYL